MQKHIKQRSIVTIVRRWYHRQGRTLPWRDIANPYRILVSEIMLQQTQVSRVLEKYPEFLRRFPTLRSLAQARQRDVVLAWRGMGYNNRAVRLHKLAKEVVEHHKGRIPQDYDALIALPGIGKYTANALLSSAFGRQLSIVDVNVQRVFSRLFWRMESTGEMRPTAEIWNLAGDLVPRSNTYDWNQALMDLGALICTARAPKCLLCPVQKLCSSRAVMKRSREPDTKHEPSLDGTPNRVYRGRVIEALRRKNGVATLRADILGRAIHGTFNTQHERWLKTLLLGLQHDGLILVRGNGTLSTMRVRLA